MKIIMFLVAALIAQPVLADPRQDEYCNDLHVIAMRATSFRDAGNLPQQVYASFFERKDGKYANPFADNFDFENTIRRTALSISDQQIKDLVNRVYFDPNYRFVRGDVLANAIFLNCTGQLKTVMPLQ